MARKPWAVDLKRLSGHVPISKSPGKDPDRVASKSYNRIIADQSHEVQSSATNFFVLRNFIFISELDQ